MRIVCSLLVADYTEGLRGSCHKPGDIESRACDPGRGFRILTAMASADPCELGASVNRGRQARLPAKTQKASHQSISGRFPQIEGIHAEVVWAADTGGGRSESTSCCVADGLYWARCKMLVLHYSWETKASFLN